jgi:hypothetical protein
LSPIPPWTINAFDPLARFAQPLTFQIDSSVRTFRQSNYRLSAAVGLLL